MQINNGRKRTGPFDPISPTWASGALGQMQSHNRKTDSCKTSDPWVGQVLTQRAKSEHTKCCHMPNIITLGLLTSEKILKDFQIVSSCHCNQNFTTFFFKTMISGPFLPNFIKSSSVVNKEMLLKEIVYSTCKRPTPDKGWSQQLIPEQAS